MLKATIKNMSQFKELNIPIKVLTAKYKNEIARIKCYVILVCGKKKVWQAVQSDSFAECCGI